MRAQRQKEVEEQIEAVNRGWKAINGVESEQFSEMEGPIGSKALPDVWEGFEEEVPTLVSKIDEYIDEDKYAAVTVEAVSISKDGFAVEKVGEESEASESEREERRNHGTRESIAKGAPSRKYYPSKAASKNSRSTKPKKKVQIREYGGAKSKSAKGEEQKSYTSEGSKGQVDKRLTAAAVSISHDTQDKNRLVVS